MISSFDDFQIAVEEEKSHSGKCCMHLNANVVPIDSHIIIKKTAAASQRQLQLKKAAN